MTKNAIGFGLLAIIIILAIYALKALKGPTKNQKKPKVK
jgi:hypothetical protein